MGVRVSHPPPRFDDNANAGSRSAPGGQLKATGIVQHGRTALESDLFGEVAELVKADDRKSFGVKPTRVRLSPSPPI